ncbi:MAG: hypothetical protein J0I12_15760 [Candidatus Eremiobacteraeota bacterium]|nr:hypothetical protein [Candidatus Eremiobacteraeota bacterium]
MQSTDGLPYMLETALENDARERFQGPLWEEFTYQDFRPAYLFGVELARDPRFASGDLDEVDDYAHQTWPGKFPFTWINMKEAIEFGFARALERN